MSEVKYSINHNIDGWPICKNGETIPNNKAMLAELHQLQARIKELEAINLGLTKTMVEMEAEKAKLVEALETVKSVLESDDPGIVCTLWVPPNVHLSETLYDHVCSALAAPHPAETEEKSR